MVIQKYHTYLSSIKDPQLGQKPGFLMTGLRARAYRGRAYPVDQSRTRALARQGRRPCEPVSVVLGLE